MTAIARLLVALVAAALILPGGAAAKELAAATVCGESGCRIVDGPPIALVEAGDGIAEATPTTSAFHTIRLVAREGDGTDHAWTVLWVPSAGLVGFVGESGEPVFEDVAAAPAAAFRQLTAGVTPFPPAGSWAEAFESEGPAGGGTSWLWWVGLAAAGALLLAALLWLTRSRWRGSSGSTPRPATPR